MDLYYSYIQSGLKHALQRVEVGTWSGSGSGSGSATVRASSKMAFTNRRVKSVRRYSHCA